MAMTATDRHGRLATRGANIYQEEHEGIQCRPSMKGVRLAGRTGQANNRAVAGYLEMRP